ncbi:MAG: hypothetical protein P8079_05040 [Gammaproteobacteria bacterium]|jgi:hypothetical protein
MLDEHLPESIKIIQINNRASGVLGERDVILMTRHGNLAAVAMGALSAGVLFYVLDRPHSHVYFLPAWLPSPHISTGLFGTIGDHLPTFLHVYAFILLTVAVTAPPISKLLPVCLAWFTLDSLLEAGQARPFARWIAAHTPAWFTGIPFLDNTRDYFLSGTFDRLDLLSIAAGTTVAYITLRLSHKSSGPSDEKHP